jgi:hypothetical protein
VEKYGRTGQAIDGNIIWRMRFACWITKAADTHIWNMQYLFFSTAIMVTRMHLSVNVIRTLAVLLQARLSLFVCSALDVSHQSVRN